MALAVDAAGNVKANPKTGKIATPPKKGGASALRAALDQDNSLNLLSIKPKPKIEESLQDQLSRRATPTNVPSHDINVISPSFSPSSISRPVESGPASPTYLSSSQPEGLAGSSGTKFSPPTNMDSTRPRNQVEWEQQAAERDGREERTNNYFGEQYDQNEDSWSQYGNTQSNDEYIRNAIAHGLTDDDAWAILHRPQSIEEDNQLRSDRNVSDDLYADIGRSIDDGTSYDYAHMTSEWMTGPQYKSYVEMGMGGRDVDDIDPTRVYSKADEARKYGFIPFLPDQSSYASMVTGDILRIPGELGTDVANLRTSIMPDYYITYGENGTRINGNEFDRLAGTFLNNYNYNLKYHPERIGGEEAGEILEYAIPNSDGGTSYAYGPIVNTYYNEDLHLSFEDGTEMDVSPEEQDTWKRDENGLLVVPEEYALEHGGWKASRDNTLYLEFADGQTVGLPEEYIRQNRDENGIIDLETLSSMVPTSQAHGQLPEDMGSIGADGYKPSLVMSDGTTIPFDDVERIYWDETAGNDPDQYDEYGNLVSTDDDISYDFMPFELNKPRRLMNQEIFDFSGDGAPVNLDDIQNNVIDWTLGSAPISTGLYMPWIYSGSQATNSMYGIEPGSYSSDTGSRSLSAGGWDENGNLRYGVQDRDGGFDEDLSRSTRNWNALLNASIPLTEQLVGPVGSHIIPLEGVTSRIPFKTDTGKLLADTLVGYGAEGVEEDLGNIFEELMQYGPSGMFANPVLDENGEAVKDIYGHEVRDTGTNVSRRIGNFANPSDLANAFAGGALVSPAMGLATTPISSEAFLRNIGPALARDAARRQTGVNRYVETDLEREVREALDEGRIPNIPTPRTVSDEYASRFENVMRER